MSAPSTRVLRSASRQSTHVKAPPSPATSPRKRPRKNGREAAVDGTGSSDGTAAPTAGASSSRKARKLEQLSLFASSSPFPDYGGPSPAQCRQVVDLLAEHHGSNPQRELGKTAYGGCGDVANVLDALVRTTISQNTTNANSTRAHRSLVDTFGTPPDCWEAILQAPLSDLVGALRCGGLAQRKAKTIHKVMSEVKKKYGGDPISLDHLHGRSNAEVIEELVSFDGIGPKTASCVLLFSMGRASFAVDTHVLRLSKALGWVPASATRDQAFHHLDLRIPDELKYPLHVLLVKHGRSCPNCAANGQPRWGGHKRLSVVTADQQSVVTSASPSVKVKQEVEVGMNSVPDTDIKYSVGSNGIKVETAEAGPMQVAPAACPLKSHVLLKWRPTKQEK